MRARNGHLAPIAAVAALLAGGSAASAIPVAPVASVADPIASAGGSVASPADLPGVELVRHTLLGDLDLGLPAAKKAAPLSNEAFGQLPPDGFAAYATGTVYHTDAELSLDEDNPAEIDLATSDAAYAAHALAAFSDELGRPIIPKLDSGSGFGRGRAVQVTPPEALGGDVDLSILDAAEAKAPPSRAPVTKETQTDASPLLKADSFKAEASARAVPTGCVIGNDLARGSGTANDTDVADTQPDDESSDPILSVSAEEPPPPRAVSQSLSRATLFPLKDRPGRFGVMAETSQTIAPVTFALPGADEKITVEVGGVWALRARADGTSGSLSFGPEPGSGDQPMLRVIEGDEAIDEVTLQELGGKTGIFVNGEPVGEIRIGGEARAIGGKPASKPTETPTRVAAAVDIAAMRLFDPPAELRVGHMEIAVAVPPGGVACPGIGMKKEAQPASVRPGDKFTWTIALTNLNDCALDKVKVVDSTTANPGVVWRVLTTLPKSSLGKDGSLTFDGVGPIRTGETKTLQIQGEVDGKSVPGTITNKASAAGGCGGAPMSGGTEASLAVGVAPTSGLAPAPTPPADVRPGRSAAGAEGNSLAAAAPADDEASVAGASDDEEGGRLPRTGAGLAGLLLGASLLAAGRFLRRYRRRRN
jgi:hypothetical protein